MSRGFNVVGEVFGDVSHHSTKNGTFNSGTHGKLVGFRFRGAG